MLDDLILLRLLAAPDDARGTIRSEVAADLRPLVPEPGLGGGSWREEFGEAVNRLARGGQLVVGGQRGARLRLSVAGRERVRAVFGVPASGSPAAASWAWWRDRYALPRALGVKRVDTAEELRVALLRQFYLPELTSDAPLGSLRTTVDLLLAKHLRTTQTGVAAFRTVTLRNWVGTGRNTSAAVLPAGPGNELSSVALPDDLADFAAQVREAAGRCETGRFGTNKVFLSHVWRALLAGGKAAPGEEAVFKERLARANTAGLLRLSRADLAGAHDAADVRASETRYLGETFHFLRLE